MPPCIDLYVLTARRDSATITRFIERYVDLAASRETHMGKVETIPTWGSGLDPETKVMKAPTLEKALELGLNKPERSFTLFLEASDCSHYQAMLCFTLDDQLVLGLSIDNEQEEMENVALAKAAMQELAKEFGAKMGLLGTELPPPETETVFVKEGEGELALYFERFGPAA